MSHRLIQSDCLDVLPSILSGSIDAVITDPPYPCIKRSYGTWTEAEWWEMMLPLVAQVRRVLKPTGSAVFVLQPNSKKVGSMRSWLWDFMAWICRDWNMIQDAWWWNPTTPPTVHVQRTRGGLRPSVKACVWCGPSDCYKDQDAVLWQQSDANAARNRADRILHRLPSGQSMRKGRCCGVADERGGVTPFNLLPIPNANSTTSAGAFGHGAGTPLPLCRWWTRYICPPGGTVLDPFSGSGTVGAAALKEGRSYVGIEKEPSYHAIATRRLEEATAQLTPARKAA